MISVAIYFGHHDSSIAVADGESVLLHLESERFFRKKHHGATAGEMEELFIAALDHLGLEPAQVSNLYCSMLNNLFPPGSVRLAGKLFDPIFVRHHECHIGSVMLNNVANSVVVCADGGSEDGTTRIYQLSNGKVECLEDLDQTHHNGKFYGTLTQLIIDPDFHGAYVFSPGKLMGLAALGKPNDKIMTLIEENALKIAQYYSSVEELRDLFSLTDDYSEPWLDQRRCDVAFNGQKYWVDSFCSKLAQYRQYSPRIALSGGCALNVLLNSQLQQSGVYEDVYVSPVSGDSGQSVGALLYKQQNLACNWPFLGRGFGECEQVPDQLIRDLIDEKIIAWFQGRSESGARGLGHRSFIGVPTKSYMREKMNDVKGREPYRPVAPIIPASKLNQYFHSEKLSPFMTYAPTAKEHFASMAPAVVHFDGTSRLQTLSPEINPVLHEALVKVGEQIGVEALMNTSFNIAGEPIVDSPEDAHGSFFASKADVLYINGERFERSD